MVSKALLPHDKKTRRFCLCSVFQAASLIFLICWIANAFIIPSYRQKAPEEKTTDAMNLGNTPVAVEKTNSMNVQNTTPVENTTDIMNPHNTTPVENTTDTMNVQNIQVEKTNDTVNVNNTPIENATDTVVVQNAPAEKATDTVNVQNTSVEKTIDTMKVPSTPVEKTTDTMNVQNTSVENTTDTMKVRNTPVEKTTNTINVQNTPVENTNDTMKVRNTPVEKTTDTMNIPNTPVEKTTDIVNVQNTPIEKTTDTMKVRNTHVEKTTDTMKVRNTPVEKTTDTIEVQNTPVEKTTDIMNVRNTPVEKTTDTMKVRNTPAEKTIKTMNVQNTPAEKTTDTMNIPTAPVEKTIDMSPSMDNRSKETPVEKPAEMKPPVKHRCKNRCIPRGSESLPQGIVVKHSSLEMRPLWGMPKKKPSSTSLLALAVGIKQKQLVDAMVRKFLSGGFVVMLFHYDGIVDEWKDLGWKDQVIHVSAINQTKWWFAKRFLHPDVVATYEYVFLWDEDLGVDNFDPLRYMSIVKEEGLEISQPALGGNKSEVHHQITARNNKGNVHRKMYKPGECDNDSKSPPCTGWIEVMAPVFSRAAWRCVWYLIQNDLIHVWGLDEQLGYCAQGDRIQNIGVVDAEYVVHHGIPTLGEPSGKKPQLHVLDKRVEVRRQSYNEYKIFRKRWEKAAKSDKCWNNPYPDLLKPIIP